MHNNSKKLRRALITGGSGEIGSAICTALAAAHASVIVHANAHVDRARQLVDKLQASGAHAELAHFDVCDPEVTQSAITKLLEVGAIDIVVNNAGFHDDAPMAGMSLAQWQRVVSVHLDGFFNVTQPLLLPMARQRWGRIVNITSLSGVMGQRGQANYAAAKSGVHGATRSLAKEMASRGITVNAIAPGWIQSDTTAQLLTLEQMRKMIPAGRMGLPCEVADLVVFLCSTSAGYITGQVIGINGGIA